MLSPFRVALLSMAFSLVFLEQRQSVKAQFAAMVGASVGATVRARACQSLRTVIRLEFFFLLFFFFLKKKNRSSSSFALSVPPNSGTLSSVLSRQARQDHQPGALPVQGSVCGRVHTISYT
jgi:hypothetical protein